MQTSMMDSISNARHCLPRLALVTILLAFVLLTPAATPRVTASALPDGLLNPDGTLNLAADFDGALNLRGWQVTLDAARGPVFQPADSQPARPTAADWHALGTGMNGTVYALFKRNNIVYAGGDFTSAGSCTSGDGCNYIAQWNGATWSALGTGMNNIVRALAISGSDVYAGGDFTDTNTPSCSNCKYIAKWDGMTWSALDTGVSSNVYALVIASHSGIVYVYAGGAFSNAGSCMGMTHGCNRIAKWDGSSWSNLGTGMNNTVYALDIVKGELEDDGDLYAGGDFTDTNTPSCSNCKYIARWNRYSWSNLGTGMNNPVYAIAISFPEVYVGGRFTSAGSCTSGCNYIAKWYDGTWSALGTGMNSYVYAIAIGGIYMYAGGAFTSAGGCASGCNFIALWNLDSGTAWSALSTGMNTNVRAIATYGDTFAGGEFTSAGSCTSNCNRIARYGNAPTAVTLSSFGATTPNLWQWLTKFLGW